MTLQKRILYGYGLSLVLVAAVLAWAIVNLVDLGRASDAIWRPWSARTARASSSC